MIIDLFIATFAVFIVVFAVKKQIKSYKKITIYYIFDIINCDGNTIGQLN